MGQVMRAFAFVLLVAAAKAEADAEAYTVGQVAHGLTAGGVVTGVDYGHGLVSGVGAVGNRAVYVAAPAVHPAVHHAAPAVYSGVHAGVYSGLNSVYGHYYGRRVHEADPLVYTTGVHAPVVSTYSHGVVAAPAVSSVVSPVVRTVASPVVSHVAAPVVRTVASPVVSHVATPAVYSGYHAGVYSGSPPSTATTTASVRLRPSPRPTLSARSMPDFPLSTPTPLATPTTSATPPTLATPTTPTLTTATATPSLLRISLQRTENQNR